MGAPTPHLDPPNRRRTAESALAALCFAAATLIGFNLHLTFSATAFLYLLIIVVVALRSGFWEATAFSVAAAASLDFFFTPPIFSFTATDPADWLSLVAFEVTALIVSRLSAQAEDHARSAELERTKIQKLFELARLTLQLDPHEPAGPQIARFVQNAIAPRSVALFDSATGAVYHEGEPGPEVDLAARTAWDRGAVGTDRHMDIWAGVLRPGPDRAGALALRGAELDPRIAEVAASIATIALERSRSIEKETRAEASRQTEQLRGAVLDALAHAFKTPLTAIRAASSGLLEAGALDPPQAELVSLIDSEAVRLTGLATRLLQTARLEGAGAQIRLVPCDLGQIVSRALAGFEGQLGLRNIDVDIPVPAPLVPGDPELLLTAMNQLIDNALKYSSPGTPIRISVSAGPLETAVAVNNIGPAIAAPDRERIFDRFYRAEGTRHRAPGTGLGLSVVKRVAEAHRGRAWVESAEVENGEPEGATFYLALPVDREAALV